MGSRHVVVVGAGIVGACTALMLQRDGNRVTLVDKGAPGEGASLGNAGCLNASSVVPVSMPGTLQQVPRWLFDPMGPLTIRWSYLPAIAPWLWRFVRAGRPERVQEIARAPRSVKAATSRATPSSSPAARGRATSPRRLATPCRWTPSAATT